MQTPEQRISTTIGNLIIENASLSSKVEDLISELGRVTTELVQANASNKKDKKPTKGHA